MKKRLFGSIAILAIAAMTAFNMNINADEKGLSDVSLENVEALAQEIGGSVRCYQEYSGTFTCASYWNGWYCPCGY